MRQLAQATGTGASARPHPRNPRVWIVPGRRPQSLCLLPAAPGALPLHSSALQVAASTSSEPVHAGDMAKALLQASLSWGRCPFCGSSVTWLRGTKALCASLFQRHPLPCNREWAAGHIQRSGHQDTRPFFLSRWLTAGQFSGPCWVLGRWVAPLTSSGRWPGLG